MSVRTDDSTAYAVNWWQVLAFDAAIGVAVAVLALLLVDGVARWLFVGAGIVYTALVVRRGLRWVRLRRAAGL